MNKRRCADFRQASATKVRIAAYPAEVNITMSRVTVHDCMISAIGCAMGVENQQEDYWQTK